MAQGNNALSPSPKYSLKILTVLIVFMLTLTFRRWGKTRVSKDMKNDKTSSEDTYDGANSLREIMDLLGISDNSIPSRPTLPPDNRLIIRHPNGWVRMSQKVEVELEQKLKVATEKKVILFWDTIYGNKMDGVTNVSECGNCEMTGNRSRINDENVGAVLFPSNKIRLNEMPEKRNLNQLYIFWSSESSATLKVVNGLSLQFEDSFKFNATVTYRRDSDFYRSDEHENTVEAILQRNTLSPEEVLELKSKMALAIVSDCTYTPGARKRLKLLRELQKLNFGFEGFGKCFWKDFPGGARGSLSFYKEIGKYKFYFAFENSYHCKHYITEKFFTNSLISLTVPVVWGPKKEDYEAVAPPRSYIFAEDFSSMKELTRYLKYLDRNDTAYLEYFRWITMKPEDMPQYGRARKWCQLCRALHGINVDDIYNPKFNEFQLKRPLFTDGIARRTVQNVSQWFYGEDNPECFNP